MYNNTNLCTLFAVLDGKGKIRKRHNENISCVFFHSFLCASYFSGQRRFGVALQRGEEFQLGFVGLLWDTYLVIWSIERPWTVQEYPLDCLIWWDDVWINCCASSLEMFLWRHTAWSWSGLEFYRNVCVHCSAMLNASGQFELRL
jgi:hypothetical protein